MVRESLEAVTVSFYVLLRIPERLVLIAGLLIIICGFLIWMPFGHGHPDIEMTGECSCLKQ